LVKPLKSRKILSKTPEKILLHDAEQMYFRKMEFDVEVTLHRPESWTSVYTGKIADARSDYNLRPETDGSTTLMYKTMIEPKGFFTRIFSPIIKPFIKRVFVGEMDVFILTMEKDFADRKKVIR
jgi:hypothetical protein